MILSVKNVNFNNKKVLKTRLFIINTSFFNQIMNFA
ncbi:hypothetical protein ECXG_01489 [Escherichia coli TA447]|uniref:Uncharacterized protein n=1 Tax=Escherichia coli TA447 TaxID=656447 RepID=A0A1X3IXW7_ECOLX|nr:hypothetical protein ECXG_01489 [Escherichia coli TA447]